MNSRINSWLLAAACLFAGLSGGLWLSSGDAPSVLPPLDLHAMASQSHDNFVIATGFVEQDVEGLFFLDFLTGDLKGAVMHSRRPGFAASYQYNIAKDFNVGAVKEPKYLMVTGMARDQQINAGGGVRLALSVLYVVEATTGQVVVYGLPWNPSLQSAGKTQQGTFIPLARGSLRSEFVRDQ